MKSKPVMLLLVAAGCGLVAMLGVQQMLSSGSQPSAKVLIAVAKIEIDAGKQLDNTNVMLKEWPQEHVPEGAITSEEQFAERALKHRIGPGQPILLSELGNKGEYGLNIKIPSDMRVVGIPVTATMTNSGLLKPGNFVDVNAAVEVSSTGGAKRTLVKSVLQCVQVFAIDSDVVGSEQSKDPKAKDVKNVSFLLYPRQAMLLHLADKQSTKGLQFALRSSSDKTVSNAGDMDEDAFNSLQNSLFGQKEEPERTPVVEKPVAVAKPMNAFRNYVAPETSAAVTSVGKQATRRTWTIEIYQGDQREVQELDWPEDGPADAKGTVNDAPDQWANPFMKFFNKRQKADVTTPVEAQSTSLIRREIAIEAEKADGVSSKE